jgi:threonine dehydratase
MRRISHVTKFQEFCDTVALVHLSRTCKAIRKHAENPSNKAHLESAGSIGVAFLHRLVDLQLPFSRLTKLRLGGLNDARSTILKLMR